MRFKLRRYCCCCPPRPVIVVLVIGVIAKLTVFQRYRSPREGRDGLRARCAKSCCPQAANSPGVSRFEEQAGQWSRPEINGDDKTCKLVSRLSRWQVYKSAYRCISCPQRPTGIKQTEEFTNLTPSAIAMDKPQTPDEKKLLKSRQQ